MFSPLPRLLNRLSFLPAARRGANHRRHRRPTLAVEVLEPRLVLATDTWTGAGAIASHANPNPNDNWSDPLNWQSEVAPQAGDLLIFPSAPTAKTHLANNDYAAGTLFNTIQISGDGYQIQGNAVTLQDGVTNVSGLNTVALDITLAAAQTFMDDAGNLNLAGTINNNGYLLTVQTGGNVLFTGKTIIGSGGLTLEGNGFTGKLYLQNSTPDRYTGVTTVLAAGVLFLDAAEGSAIVGNLVAGDGPGPNQNDVVRFDQNNQISNSSSVTIYADGLVDLDGFNDTIGSLTMSGGYFTTGTGLLTLNGNVTTLASTTTAQVEGNLSLGTSAVPRTFTIASGSAGTDLDVSATVSGVAGAELLKTGAGTMRLSGNNSYAGPTLMSAGTLATASPEALGSGSVTVGNGATLDFATAGDNALTINGNLVNNGEVEIDGDGTVGTLSVRGNYTQAGTATLKLALASTSAIDQLAVSGNATLAGTLTVGLQGGFQPVGGNQFEIMTFGIASGSFGTVDLPMRRVLTLRRDPHDLTIVDTAPPPGPGGPTVPPARISGPAPLPMPTGPTG